MSSIELDAVTKRFGAVEVISELSLTINSGEFIAFLGPSGCGKSTLLRCLAGILAPEEGRVIVRGRITSLLTIGIGMNGNLTGRENIKLGGLAVGLSERRLNDLTDEIAEFAQLGEYVDLPVSTYSSGMRARLGFAVTAHLDPEVLLIDEALAGGDSKFQQAVGEKMAEICGNGRTIVLVSHGLKAIQEMATSALWLHQGKVVEHGDPDDVVNSYMRFCRIESLASEFDY